jgi:hypothetical protein
MEDILIVQAINWNTTKKKKKQAYSAMFLLRKSRDMTQTKTQKYSNVTIITNRRELGPKQSKQLGRITQLHHIAY